MSNTAHKYSVTLQLLFSLVGLVILPGAQLLGPSLACAATPGHHEPAIADLGPLAVNFLIYAFLLYYLLRKPLAAFWHMRRKQTSDQLAASAAALEESQGVLALADRRSRSAAQDKAALEERLARESQQEAANVITQARLMAERIAQQAELSAAAERRSAEDHARTQIVEQIIMKARQRLQEASTFEGDRTLRSSAVRGIRSLIRQ